MTILELPSQKIERLGWTRGEYQDYKGCICASAALVTLPLDDELDYEDLDADEMITDARVTYGNEKIDSLLSYVRNWRREFGEEPTDDDVNDIAWWNDAVGKNEVLRVLKSLGL